MAKPKRNLLSELNCANQEISRLDAALSSQRDLHTKTVQKYSLCTRELQVARHRIEALETALYLMHNFIRHHSLESWKSEHPTEFPELAFTREVKLAG